MRLAGTWLVPATGFPRCRPDQGAEQHCCQVAQVTACPGSLRAEGTADVHDIKRISSVPQWAPKQAALVHCSHCIATMLVDKTKSFLRQGLRRHAWWGPVLCSCI